MWVFQCVFAYIKIDEMQITGVGKHTNGRISYNDVLSVCVKESERKTAEKVKITSRE